MPYERIDQLPDSVRDHVPKHGQEIYRAAFNSGWDDYRDAERRRGSESREAAARRVAWSAVKQKYAKRDDDDWHAA